MDMEIGEFLCISHIYGQAQHPISTKYGFVSKTYGRVRLTTECDQGVE